MTELLTTYTAADAGSALGDARDCVRAAIGDPDTFLFDHLLNLKPVQCLEQGAPKVHKLLTVFVSGNLQEYLEFYEKEKDFVTSEMGLQHETLQQKMRILTMMSVGEAREEVTFAELAKMLRLNPGEELEEFIIKTAKMDQVQEKLLIAGVTNRRFEMPQWEQLRGRLDAWAANLRMAREQVKQVVAA